LFAYVECNRYIEESFHGVSARLMSNWSIDTDAKSRPRASRAPLLGRRSSLRRGIEMDHQEYADFSQELRDVVERLQGHRSTQAHARDARSARLMVYVECPLSPSGL
jgi:hypothetical protein